MWRKERVDKALGKMKMVKQEEEDEQEEEKRVKKVIKESEIMKEDVYGQKDK